MPAGDKYVKYTDEEVVEFLSHLPEEGTIDYSNKIIDFLEHTSPSVRHQLNDILVGKLKRDVRFNAFYTLCKLFIRYDSLTEFNKLVDDHGKEYVYTKLYNVVLATYFKNKREHESLLLAVDYIKAAQEDLGNHKGVLNQFAETVAICIEQGITLEPRVIDDALLAINKAIRLDNKYPKYYFNKGRLLAHKLQFAVAKQQVQQAIDTENMDRADYPVRIGNYKYYLLYIQTLEASHNLKHQIIESENVIRKEYSTLQDQTKQNTTRSVELLGFFAGILSLIIGASTTVSKFQFKDAASLLLVLAGILVLSFSLLRKILHDKSFWKETASLASLGLLLIALGYFSSYYYYEPITKNTSGKNAVDSVGKAK